MRSANDPHSAVMALHSSGAGARQWQAYRALIDPGWHWSAPDLLGYAAGETWLRGGTASLDAEARRVAPWMQRTDGAPLHLVGHSYGGSVALQVALNWPERVASLTLYEPVRFALLRETDPVLWREIVDAGRHIGALALEGRDTASAQVFVDYWSGAGAWQRLPAARQSAVALRMPKVQAEFEALFADPVPTEAYGALRVPLLVVCGTASPAPARRVAERLAAICPQAELVTLTGADHMAPLLQPERFAALLPCAAPRALAAEAA
jgi:pimeloyl-ACP methyl ester carboxylesterase